VKSPNRVADLCFQGPGDPMEAFAVEEQCLLFSVRLACRRVRTFTDREQPRRKLVRCRQVTRTSRPHSKKWRALGCYLPSKWSGWTVRRRRERARRPADPLGTPPCPDVFVGGAPCPLSTTDGAVSSKRQPGRVGLFFQAMSEDFTKKLARPLSTTDAAYSARPSTFKTTCCIYRRPGRSSPDEKT
jgi:hypothetical protein